MIIFGIFLPEWVWAIVFVAMYIAGIWLILDWMRKQRRRRWFDRRANQLHELFRDGDE